MAKAADMNVLEKVSIFFRTALKQQGTDLKNYETGTSIPDYMFSALSSAFRSATPVEFVKSSGPGFLTTSEDVTDELGKTWAQTHDQSFPQKLGTGCNHPLFDVSRPLWFQAEPEKQAVRRSKDRRFAILTSFENTQGQTSAVLYAFLKGVRTQTDTTWQQAYNRSTFFKDVLDRPFSLLSSDIRHFVGRNDAVVVQARQIFTARDGHTQHATLIFSKEALTMRYSMSGRRM